MHEVDNEASDTSLVIPIIKVKCYILRREENNVNFKAMI
jgi:hypothetical protein